MMNIITGGGVAARLEGFIGSDLGAEELLCLPALGTDRGTIRLEDIKSVSHSDTNMFKYRMIIICNERIEQQKATLS
jgi:hypothetical protein